MIRTEFDSHIILDAWKGYNSIRETDSKNEDSIKLYVNGFSANYVQDYSDAQLNAINYSINSSKYIQKLLLFEISKYAIDNNISIVNLKQQVKLHSISIKKIEKNNFAYTNYIFQINTLNSQVHKIKVFTLKEFVYRIKKI